MNENVNFFLVGGGSRLNTCLPVFLNSYANIELSGLFISKEEDFESICNSLSVHKTKIVKKWSTFLDIVNKSKNAVVVFISYNKLIEPKDFKSARLINYHASPLPKYRGGSPMNWAIINGEIEFGVSIHELVKSIDAGPILVQENFCIENYDYIQLVERVNKAFLRLTKILLSSFDTFWEYRISQDERLVSFFHQRSPENSRVSFSEMTSNKIMNTFKALPSPLPRPYFKYMKNIFVISSCKLPQGKYFGQPGRVIGNHENGIVVICKTGSIVLEKLLDVKNNTEHHAKKILKPGDQIND